MVIDNGRLQGLGIFFQILEDKFGRLVNCEITQRSEFEVLKADTLSGDREAHLAVDKVLVVLLNHVLVVALELLLMQSSLILQLSKLALQARTLE